MTTIIVLFCLFALWTVAWSAVCAIGHDYQQRKAGGDLGLRQVLWRVLR